MKKCPHCGSTEGYTEITSDITAFAPVIGLDSSGNLEYGDIEYSGGDNDGYICDKCKKRVAECQNDMEEFLKGE